MKSIQQILEEQRSLSKINEVTEAHINRSLANEWKKDNSEFSETMKQVASQRDEVYHEKRRQGLAKRDNSYQAIDNARTEKQAQISKSLKEN